MLITYVSSSEVNQGPIARHCVRRNRASSTQETFQSDCGRSIARRQRAGFVAPSAAHPPKRCMDAPSACSAEALRFAERDSEGTDYTEPNDKGNMLTTSLVLRGGTRHRRHRRAGAARRCRAARRPHRGSMGRRPPTRRAGDRPRRPGARARASSTSTRTTTACCSADPSMTPKLSQGVTTVIDRQLRHQPGAARPARAGAAAQPGRRDGRRRNASAPSRATSRRSRRSRPRSTAPRWSATRRCAWWR